MSFQWVRSVSCVILLGLPLLVGCGGDELPARQKMKLRLGLALQPTSALIMIAEEDGFFEQEGLDVSITTYPSGKRALKDGLLKGDVEMITSAEVPIALHSFTAQDVVIVGSIGYADSIQKIIARKDSGVTVPADLSGKRVATQKGSAVHFFWNQFRLLHGITGYEISFMKAEDLPGALAGGFIDAFSMREPFIGEAQDLLGDNSVIFSEPGVYISSEVLVAARGYAQEHPEVVKAFLRALLRAEKRAVQEPERCRDIVTKRLGADPAEMEGIWPRFDHRLELAQTLLLNLEDIALWAMEQELGGQGTPPDYRTVMSASFLKSVAPERVSLIE